MQALVIDDADVELVRSVLLAGAEHRSRAAEEGAALLEAERRTGSRKDLRAGHSRVARVLAEASALRRLAGAELLEVPVAGPVVDAEDGAAVRLPPPGPDPQPGPGDTPAAPAGTVPDRAGADTVAGDGVIPPPPGLATDPVVEADTDEPAGEPDGGGEGDDVRTTDVDVQLDSTGEVVGMSTRQQARQELAEALAASRPKEHVPGRVYALSPATLDLIAAVEGEGVPGGPGVPASRVADDGVDRAATFAGQEALGADEVLPA